MLFLTFLIVLFFPAFVVEQPWHHPVATDPVTTDPHLMPTRKVRHLQSPRCDIFQLKFRLLLISVSPLGYLKAKLHNWVKVDNIKVASSREQIA